MELVHDAGGAPPNARARSNGAASHARGWVLERLRDAARGAPSALVTGGRQLARLEDVLVAALGHDAVPMTLPTALAAAPDARVRAWSSRDFSRVTWSALALLPIVHRIEIVAIPRGDAATALLRADVDPLGLAHVWVDAFGPGGAHVATRRAWEEPLRAFFDASATFRIGGVRPSPAWLRALSCGGGRLVTRDVEGLVRALAATMHAVADVGRAHRAEKALSSFSSQGARSPALDAAHRTMSDALRAHDPATRLVRWRLGAAFSAHLDDARFADR